MSQSAVQYFPHLQMLWAECNGASDRSVCVLGGSVLEVQTETLLRAFLLADSATLRALFGSGPLNTFAAQSHLLFALGLITRTHYGHLDQLRKIRNHAAHNVQVSFTKPPIAQHCEALGLRKAAESFAAHAPAYSSAPWQRLVFFLAVAQLSFDLSAHAQDIVARHRRQELAVYPHQNPSTA